MRLPQSTTLLLLANAVAAFKDTSPFFLLSTSAFPSLSSSGITSGNKLFHNLIDAVSSCPSQAYILVTQPGVFASDFVVPGVAPHLREALVNDTSLQTTVTVPEVLGYVDLDVVAMQLEAACGARVVNADVATGVLPSDVSGKRIVRVAFSTPPNESRSRHSKLSENDSLLNAILSTIGHKQYTIIYSTTPPSGPMMPPTFDDEDESPLMHNEFKRNVQARGGSGTTAAKAPLFAKYIFLSPALYMTAFILLPIFFLAYVALSALLSLQVSYFAFSKEMGPTGAKKAQ